MKMALERGTVGQLGWLILLLMGAWLAFVFVPAPRPKPPPPPAVAPAPQPISNLAAVGLPNNPDFDGLPEIFALWADQAEWVNDRTVFGYWNPATLDYSYVFEATRRNGRFHFRPVPRPEDFKVALAPNESQPPEHPLRFIPQPRMARTPEVTVPPPPPPLPARQDLSVNRGKVPVDVSGAPIKPEALPPLRDPVSDRPRR